MKILTTPLHYCYGAGCLSVLVYVYCDVCVPVDCVYCCWGSISNANRNKCSANESFCFFKMQSLMRSEGGS